MFRQTKSVSRDDGELAFLLDATYRLRQGRAEIHLFGRLETGETFLARDPRPRPRFYLRRRDAGRAEALGLRGGQAVSLRGFRDNEPLMRYAGTDPAQLSYWRRRLHDAAIPTYEADVTFPTRYLMDRDLRSALRIQGPWRPGRGTEQVDRVYRCPRLVPARWALNPWILSIDIETDPRARRVLSIALVGDGRHGPFSEVLLLSPSPLTTPADAQGFDDERQLLRAFALRLRHHDPDVITGWNVIDFDLAVLAVRARQLGVPLPLGRDSAPLKLRRGRGRFASGRARIPGRVVLDGIQLLLTSYVRMERHGLDHVAREVLGKGKTDLEEQDGAEETAAGSDVRPKNEPLDRGEQILHLFHHRRELFVRYNRNDALLVLEILETLGLVRLAVERSLITGLPLDRVAGAVAAFDFLYLGELQRRRLAAPTVDSPQLPSDVGAGGGHVLEPRPGLYDNVLVFDFRSLYPSLIRTFGIDPLTRLETHHGAGGTDRTGTVEAPNGAAFERHGGILPRLLDDLAPQRAAAQAAGDNVASQALKILMNSFYGVLGATGCRFRHPQLTGAITSFGRELLLWTAGRAQSHGHRVLYGDTDSLFVEASKADEASLSSPAALQRGRDLAERLNRDLQHHLEQRWGVDSRLELQFERLFRRLVLLPTRTTGGGARKRYAGVTVTDDGGERLVLTGMEAVRRDWTDLARRAQRELYQRLFSDRPVDAYLAELVEATRTGHLDGELVYRKRLRKALHEYTATSPPHVVAARKAQQLLQNRDTTKGSNVGKEDRSRSVGRSVSYVISRGGPEPVTPDGRPLAEDFDPTTLDREHYVQRQIRPVAEPILDLLGLRFESVVGDPDQLRLF